MAIVIPIAAAVVAVGLIAIAPLRKKKALVIPSLAEKHVFITGASSGIGLAIAKQALLEGAYVTLSARNEGKLAKAVEQLGTEIPNAVERIKSTTADVTNYSAIATAVKEAFSWKPIDVLVCNAGLARAGYFDDIPIEVHEEVVQTNLVGAIYTVHSAIPLMKSRCKDHKTSIVIVSSAAALFILYGNAVYTATKHALRGLADCLRLELLPYDINVSLICPGFVKTALLDDVDKEGEFDVLLKKLNLYDPKNADSAEEIAEWTLNAVKKGSYLVTPKRFFPLVTLSRGFISATSLMTTLSEAFWFPLIRLITFKSSKDIRKLVINHHNKNHLH